MDEALASRTEGPCMLPPVVCRWSSDVCSIRVLLSKKIKFTVVILDCSSMSSYILSISGLPPLCRTEYGVVCHQLDSVCCIVMGI